MMKACLNSGSSTGLPVEPLPQEHQCMQCSPLTVNNEFFLNQSGLFLSSIQPEWKQRTRGEGWGVTAAIKDVIPVWIISIREDLIVSSGDERAFRSSEVKHRRRHVMRRELGPWTRWIKEAHTGEWYIPTRRSILAERSDNQDWHKSKGCSGKRTIKPRWGTTARKSCQLRHCSGQWAQKT